MTRKTTRKVRRPPSRSAQLTGGKKAGGGQAPKRTTTPGGSNEKKRLGRGLDALLGLEAGRLADDLSQTPDDTSRPTTIDDQDTRILMIKQLLPSPWQPRREFAPEALQELTQSIVEHGVLQPIVVRKNTDDEWEIVAGERRWRAAQAAGLKQIPVVIRQLTDAQTMTIALVENIQRIDLNPVEKARGMARLQKHNNFSHEEIADLIGCSRVSVTNNLRLLKLNPAVLDLLGNNKLQAGHARPLLALDSADQLRCAHQIVRKQMSAAAVEKMVRELQNPSQKQAESHDLRTLERELSDRLSARVTVRASARRAGGRIVVHCTTTDSLDGVIDKLKKLR